MRSIIEHYQREFDKWWTLQQAEAPIPPTARMKMAFYECYLVGINAALRAQVEEAQKNEAPITGASQE